MNCENLLQHKPSGKQFQKDAVNTKENFLALPQLLRSIHKVGTKDKTQSLTKNRLLEPAPLLVLLFVLFFVFQIRHRGFEIEHPQTFDEGLYTWFAVHLIEHPEDYSAKMLHDEAVKNGQKFLPAVTHYLTKPVFKHPPLYPLILKQAVLATRKIQSVTLVPALMGCLVILCSYFLTKHAYGLFAAGLSVFFLAIDPNLWINSQKMWMESALTAFMIGSIFCFSMAVSASERRKWIWFLLSGAACGGAANMKYAGFLPLGGFFAYAALFDRKLLKNVWFWAVPVVVGLTMIPWILKNFSVYGGDLSQSEFLPLMIPSVEHRALLARFLFGGIGFVAFGSAAAFFASKRGGSDLKGELQKRERRQTRLSGILGAIFLIALCLQPNFLKSVGGMLSIKSLPTSGWTLGFFQNEPWSFYFGRFLELSPFYLLSYFIFFLPFLVKEPLAKCDWLLCVQAVVMMTALVVWRNFQCRYALAATSILLLLSARVLAASWQWTNALESVGKRRFMKAVLIAFFVFATVKTLIVGVRFVMPNAMAYY